MISKHMQAFQEKLTYILTTLQEQKLKIVKLEDTEHIKQWVNTFI